MQEKFTAFENRLAKVYKHISKIARKQHVTCFRVYAVDLPEFPFLLMFIKSMFMWQNIKVNTNLAMRSIKHG